MSKPELLDITVVPYSDTRIEDYQFHAYQPYATDSLNYNDEIRTSVQDLEANTAPCNSYLNIEGSLITEEGAISKKIEFVNNAIVFLFKEIRYELNGTVTNSIREVGLVQTLKGYLSYNDNETTLLHNAGWFPNKIKTLKYKAKKL